MKKISQFDLGTFGLEQLCSNRSTHSGREKLIEEEETLTGFPDPFLLEEIWYFQL